MKKINSLDFRNYANDALDLDTGTPSGLGRYLEWLEEIIVDDNKLAKVKADIKEFKDTGKEYVHFGNWSQIGKKIDQFRRKF